MQLNARRTYMAQLQRCLWLRPDSVGMNDSIRAHTLYSVTPLVCEMNIVAQDFVCLVDHGLSKICSFPTASHLMLSFFQWNHVKEEEQLVQPRGMLRAQTISSSMLLVSLFFRPLGFWHNKTHTSHVRTRAHALVRTHMWLSSTEGRGACTMDPWRGHGAR